jgi:hypothetical protein
MHTSEVFQPTSLPSMDGPAPGRRLSQVGATPTAWRWLKALDAYPKVRPQPRLAPCARTLLLRRANA